MMRQWMWQSCDELGMHVEGRERGREGGEGGREGGIGGKEERRRRGGERGKVDE